MENSIIKITPDCAADILSPVYASLFIAPVIKSHAAVTLSGSDGYRNEMLTAARSRNRFSIRQGKLFSVVCFYARIFHSFGKQISCMEKLFYNQI